MFEQAIRASEALRDALQHNEGSFVPALCGYPKCQSVRMISTAVLGQCADCGSEMVAVEGEPNSSPHLCRNAA